MNEGEMAVSPTKDRCVRCGIRWSTDGNRTYLVDGKRMHFGCLNKAEAHKVLKPVG